MIEVKKTNGGMAYTSPFVGPTNHPTHLPIKVAELTTKEVDIDGRLKPGVPFKADGTLCDGTAGEKVYGVTIEAENIVAKNPTNAILAADTRIVNAGVATICQVNRYIARDILGRPYTAQEIAAFAGTPCVLTAANPA